MSEHPVLTRSATAAGVAVLAGVALWQGYRRTWGPGHDRWGATDEEVAAHLPGDELVPDPAAQNTRAITIAATPAQVWPWLVQVGADRAGFYSHDWLENLAGLRIHSADRVVDEWQHLAVGDVVRASNGADEARSGGWYVVELLPEKALVLQLADLPHRRPARRTDPGGFEFLWTFALADSGDGTTRLLVRERVAFGNRWLRTVMAPTSLVSFVMTRQMLRGIKARAEAPAQ
jgi:hypothetical protein